MASYYVYPPGIYIPGPSFPSSPTAGTTVFENSFPSSPLSSSSTPSLPGLPEAPRPRTVPLPDVDGVQERYTAPRSSRVLLHPSVADYSRLGFLHRPAVDPLLAVLQRPTARPSLQWDLLHDPTTALLGNPSVSQADLSRCAIRSGGTERAPPLQSLVLIFPLLHIEIEVRASVSGTSRHAANSVRCLTVGDVLEGLYRGLRAPIEPCDFVRLSESEQRTLLRACEARCRCLPEDERSRHALRKVDHFARRRFFLGIRPAMPSEVPDRRKFGEVYVVEVGTGDM